MKHVQGLLDMLATAALEQPSGDEAGEGAKSAGGSPTEDAGRSSTSSGEIQDYHTRCFLKNAAATLVT